MNINKQYYDLIENTNGSCKKVTVYTVMLRGSNIKYVGYTERFKDRRAEHIRNLAKGQHANVRLQEYFNFACLTKGDVYVESLYEGEFGRELEDFILQEIDYFKCYNISNGGSSGDTLYNHPYRLDILEERRQKSFGESNKNWRGGSSKTTCKSCGKELKTYKNKGKKCSLCYFKERDVTGELNPFYGKKHSEEVISSLREKRIGKLPTNSVKVIIFGVVYNSISEASKSLGINSGTLRHRVLSNNIAFKEYLILGAVKTETYKLGDKIKTITIFAEGKLYQTYKTVAETFNLSIGAVIGRIKSKNFPEWYVIKEQDESK